MTLPGSQPASTLAASYILPNISDGNAKALQEQVASLTLGVDLGMRSVDEGKRIDPRSKNLLAQLLHGDREVGAVSKADLSWLTGNCKNLTGSQLLALWALFEAFEKVKGPAGDFAVSVKEALKLKLGLRDPTRFLTLPGKDTGLAKDVAKGVRIALRAGLIVRKKEKYYFSMYPKAVRWVVSIWTRSSLPRQDPRALIFDVATEQAVVLYDDSDWPFQDSTPTLVIRSNLNDTQWHAVMVDGNTRAVLEALLQWTDLPSTAVDLRDSNLKPPSMDQPADEAPVEPQQVAGVAEVVSRVADMPQTSTNGAVPLEDPGALGSTPSGERITPPSCWAGIVAYLCGQ